MAYIYKNESITNLEHYEKNDIPCHYRRPGFIA
jgi:hypothetical protein